MLRIKRIHKQILTLVSTLYMSALLFYEIFSESREVKFSPTNLIKLDQDIYLLSAFWETRSLNRTNFVRILTISRVQRQSLFKLTKHDIYAKQYKNDAFNVSCEIVSEDNEKVLGELNFQIYEETIDPNFVGTFFNCHPLHTLSSVPDTVRIQSQEGTSVILPVQSIQRKSKTSFENQKSIDSQTSVVTSNDVNTPAVLSTAVGSKRNRTAVCVRALYGPFANIKQLGEFISFYSEVLGVERFSFYLLEVTPAILEFLANLQNKQDDLNIQLRLVFWDLDEELKINSKSLWDYGALTLLTDCLYSGMSEYEYTYIVDLDEYIMPRYTTAARNKTDVLVSRALESINSGQGKNVDNFLFRNTFFCSEFNKKVDYENNFDIFKILSRQKSIWSPRLRAKMLVRTMTAIAVGHHSIFEFVDPVNSCNYPVPHQIAMLNHYRSCLDLNSGFMGLGEPVLSDDVEYDDTALVHQYSINKSPISIFIRQHIQDSVSP